MVKEFTLEQAFDVSAKQLFDFIWSDVSFQRFWHTERGDTGVEATEWTATDKDGQKERSVTFKSPVKGEFLRKLAGKQHTDVEEKQIMIWKSDNEIDFVNTLLLDVPMKESIIMNFYWSIRSTGPNSCTMKDVGKIEFNGMWALKGTIEGVMTSESVESHTSFIDLAKTYIQKEMEKLAPPKPEAAGTSNSAENPPEDENSPESLITRIQQLEKSVDTVTSKIPKPAAVQKQTKFTDFFEKTALPYLPSNAVSRAVLAVFLVLSVFPMNAISSYLFYPSEAYLASPVHSAFAALFNLIVCATGFCIVASLVEEKNKSQEQIIESLNQKVSTYEKQLSTAAPQVLESDLHYELDIAQKETKYRIAQVEKARSTVDRLQKKIEHLHSSLTKRNQQMQIQMDAVSKVIDLNKQISESTIEQLNPQHKDKSGLELIEMSNKMIEKCMESAKTLLDECQDEIAQAMLTMFLENAGLRKCNNDYVEELLRSSFEKLERFESEFHDSRDESQGGSSAGRAQGPTFEKIVDLDDEDKKKYPRVRSHSISLPMEYRELTQLQRFGALRQRPNIPLWRREALLPLNYTNIIDEYDASESRQSGRISSLSSSSGNMPFPIHVDGTGGAPVEKKAPHQPNQSEGDKFFRELFGLPSTETVVEYFSCVNSSLLHGYLYVTPNYICFDTLLFAGGHNKVVFPLTKISKLRKTKFANILPNALEFLLETGEVHFYSGFISRNDAYRFICDQANKSQRNPIGTPTAPETKTIDPAPKPVAPIVVESRAKTLSIDPPRKDSLGPRNAAAQQRKEDSLAPPADNGARKNSVRTPRADWVDKIVGGRRNTGSLANPINVLTSEDDANAGSSTQ